MKYLITGGAGFIGSAMVRKIIRNKENFVLNIDSLTYASNLDSLKIVNNSPNYTFEKEDICNEVKIYEIFKKFNPDYIIHFAAESHVDNSIQSPDIFIKTNILGTYNLLNNSLKYYKDLDSKKKKVFRFLHISTDEVFGDLGETNQFFCEDTPYNPSSPYSASKASSDHLVKAWKRTYDLPILLTNCSNNYGPYQHKEKLIPTVIRKILTNSNIPIYGKGENIRDWLYVEDHIEAILTVLKYGKIGQSYNIGGNNQIKNIDLVKQICSLMDAKTKNKSKNLESSFSLIKFVQDRAGHDVKYAINAEKIKTDLGWSPNETFSTGIEKTIDWYLDNKSFLQL